MFMIYCEILVELEDNSVIKYKSLYFQLYYICFVKNIGSLLLHFQGG